ncbi:MAG: arsenate reductase (glutaredoxin) [Limisphaerales bacterium]
MAKFEIYHNPRCSKSRNTLKLLEENGVEPDVRLYLDTPPNAKELKAILKLLGIGARELLRKGEDEYQDLKLADKSLSEAKLIDAMTKHPRLIERPIVIRDGKAAKIGRPPENALELVI